MTQRKLRVNGLIRVPQVRAINAEGKLVGVVATAEAIELAKAAGLDLVEVDPMSNPPVCRIMDFGRFKYQQKKKGHGAERRKSSSLKEVWLRPKIGQHDKEIKVNRMRQFLGEHHRVLVTMRFRGREMEHQDLARNILAEIAEQLAEKGKIEQHPLLTGRRMAMVLAPK